MVDVKLMNQIKDIDLVDRTVTVGPGINVMTLNRELKQYGVIYPDDPASYPCSATVGGRIACSGMSLLNSPLRAHAGESYRSRSFSRPAG